MIKFRTELPAFSFPHKMKHGQQILLVGSCFTEHMGNYLADSGFHILQNPHGILFNPLSVQKAIDDYLECSQYEKESLTYNSGLFHSWNHHSRFSYPDANHSIFEINKSNEYAHSFLKNTDWLVLTLGSAFVYHLVENNIPVANCHKFNANTFTKKLLSPIQTEEVLNEIINKVQAQIPNIKILLTVSPVRHAREGLIENNRSKASLLYGVHAAVANFDNVFYFPSYELVMDDLRDYRFFMEDLIHPNKQATDYVWGRFKESLFSQETEQISSKVQKLKTSARHKSFNPDTPENQAFLQKLSADIVQLKKSHSRVFIDEELAAKIID